MLFPFLFGTGGLILFFAGMHWIKKGLTRIGRRGIKTAIRCLTTTPLLATLTGTVITMLFQSSSAVTVLTVGLVNSGLMTFVQGLGIVLGTNIGTTFTIQLLAFDFDLLAPWLLMGGLLCSMVFTGPLQGMGETLSGLGMVFCGLHLFRLSFAPLQNSSLFLGWLSSLGDNYSLALVTGLMATALLQSSTAVTAVTIVLGSQGYLSLETAIALMLGSNIGTCSTALLASFRSCLEARRIAMAHVVLNVLGAIIFFPLIDFFADCLRYLSPLLPRQIAHGHTLFNLISSLLVLPFLPCFARLIIFLVPDKK
jgi:phosphate:Na+ symporter